MTSREIIKAVAEKMDSTQKATKAYADAFEAVLKEYATAMDSDSKIKVMDVTFTKKDVAEREGRNPSTGDSITIPATKKLAVKLSSSIKEAVRA